MESDREFVDRIVSYNQRWSDKFGHTNVCKPDLDRLLALARKGLEAECPFPIIPYSSREQGKGPHPMSVPWRIAELAYSVYASRYGRSQSLERLAERGGFHAGEMDMLLPDWRERYDAALKGAPDA